MTLRQDYLNQRQIPIRVLFQENDTLESMTKEPEPKTVLETRLITSINNKRYEIITPITIEIKRIDHEYIVKFFLIDIFAFGNDLDKTIAEFLILLVDYYKSLLRKEKSLAVHLRKELEILKQYLKEI